MAFLEPILAGVSVGLTALAEAAGRGQIEIGADKLLHLPPIRPLDEEVEPRKTREAVFKQIGSVQLPDLLLEVDAATSPRRCWPADRRRATSCWPSTARSWPTAPTSTPRAWAR